MAIGVSLNALGGHAKYAVTCEIASPGGQDMSGIEMVESGHPLSGQTPPPRPKNAQEQRAREGGAASLSDDQLNARDCTPFNWARRGHPKRTE